MGDTTNVQVYIYACPDDQRAAMLEILEYHRLSPDWYGPTGDTLELGQAYGSNYAAGDESEEIAAEIIEAAPGAVFQAWTDPAYEWLGSGVMYTPELGRFGYESDSNGEPQFGQAAVLDAIASGDVEKAIGVPWRDAMIRAAKELKKP